MKNKKDGISLVDGIRWRKKRRQSVLNNPGTSVSRQEGHKWRDNRGVCFDRYIRHYWDTLKRILAFCRRDKITVGERRFTQE